VIFVTHDIGVACEIADEVAVMYAGQILERTDIESLMDAPAHPYTRGLLHSVVTPASIGARLDPIPGVPPNIADLPPGCSFAPRCVFTRGACLSSVPALINAAHGGEVRCIMPEAGGHS
jgi:peptide/nickel transport system ATP-binding protein